MSTFKIRFLGTCAADYSPRLLDEFKDCYDLDARRSSAALINGRYLIDCGEHILDEFRISGEDMACVTDLFVTHLHADHYNPEHIRIIASKKKEPLRVWVREDAVLPDIPNISVVRMKDLETYKVDEDMSVVGLAANHDPCTAPRHLLFLKDGKKLFYGLDGGWLTNSTYNYLKRAAVDMMVLDATVGDYVGDFRMAEHNSIPMIRLMLASFKTFKITHEDTLVYLSHIAPSLHKPHKETADMLSTEGMHLAYDGLTVEI